MRVGAPQASQCARPSGLEGAVPSKQVGVEVVLEPQLAREVDQELGVWSEADSHDVKVGSPSIDSGMEVVDTGDSHTVPLPYLVQGNRQVALNDAIARRPGPCGDRSSQCRMMSRVRRDLVGHAFRVQRDYPDIHRDRRAASSLVRLVEEEPVA